MKDRVYEPNPKVVVSCRPPSSLWRRHSTEKFQSRPKMASTTSQGEISRRIYVIYFFVLHRWAKLAEHCVMELDYFGSFLQSLWLSIFVVHEIQLRPRCIMESANGSLMLNKRYPSLNWSISFSSPSFFSKSHFPIQVLSKSHSQWKK